MQCPQCGQENRDVAQFCQHCGTLLTTAKLTEREPPPEPDTKEAGKLVTEGQMLPESRTTLDAEPATMSMEHEPLSSVAEPQGPDVSLEAEPVHGEAVLEEVEVSVETTEADDIHSGEDVSDEPAERETIACAPQEEQTAEAEPEQPAATEPAASTEVPEPIYGDTASDQSSSVEDESLLDEPLTEAEDQETLVPIEEGTPIETEHPDETWLLESADVLPWHDEPVPVEPLETGTVVCGRYLVVEVLSADKRETLYRARDLQRCPQCGYTENSPDQAFCASCGAAMEQKPVTTMLERPIERSADPVEAEVEDQFTAEGRAYWVWREVSEHTGSLGGSGGVMRMTIGQRSDNGQVRELDEDSLFVLTMSRTHESIEDTMALFVVADGMGGHEGGEIASKIAIQMLADALLHDVFLPELGDASLGSDAISDRMRQAVEAANDQVYLERQKRQNDMGTTMTAALLKEWTLYLAHVGDCRAYRWSENGLEQVTTDHSVVASMVASGAAQPDEIYTHPQRSVIYRCIGDQPTVDVETVVMSVSPGDRLVLCCDGLWEMLRDEGIEEVMLRESDPQEACESMVEQANIAGGSDNISVIVVQL
jgi:serine/threonine protein phosphatase PrpC